jgi:glyoxylase-like metal-dependent hydrolase (beta-lactamase superfamily II)
MLTTHNVLPIALGDNWVYALPSNDGTLLIDAGPDYPGAWDALIAQLEAAGLWPGEIWGVVITHAHIDHCGLAAQWQEMGVTIFGAEAEFPRFQQGDRVIGFQSELVFKLMAACGTPAERIVNFQERRARLRDSTRQPDPKRERNRRRERWPGMLKGTPFTPQGILVDGHILDLGERSIQFLTAPGHTPGNAVLYEEATGALFSGDQLLPHVTPNPGIHFATDGSGERFRSLPAFTRSMEKLRDLSATHLYPGHGEHVSGVTPLIEKTLDHHHKRQQRVLRFLREGPLTPYAVMEKFFPHLPDTRLWQATAEIVGHIDALAEEGLVVEERDESGRILIRLP